jgi:hypothetical protein
VQCRCGLGWLEAIRAQARQGFLKKEHGKVCAFAVPETIVEQMGYEVKGEIREKIGNWWGPAVVRRRDWETLAESRLLR